VLIHRATTGSPDDRPHLLHACVHNSGRSVAALLLTRHYAGDAVVVGQCGVGAGTSVNPVVAQVLEEPGLAVADHVPTLLEPDLVRQPDVVVTMGCGEACPIFPGKRYEDWPVDDPAGEDVATVRRIVGDLDHRVRRLLAGVAPALALPPALFADAT
jgi:arsenate reductase (thioredoxin)